MSDSFPLKLPKVSLEQWTIFLAITQTGSYAKAAEQLHKSQSAISYNMSKMQQQLGIDVFKLNGRKATLTTIGQQVLARSQQIVSQCLKLENAISHFSAGAEHALTVLVDELFPTELLAIALKKFEAKFPETHLQIINSRANQTLEQLNQQAIDCAITRNQLNNQSQEVISLEYYPYAHPDYIKQNSGDTLCLNQLHHFRQITHEAFKSIITNHQTPHCCQWQVDSLTMMIELIANKQGYGWLPKLHAEKSLLPLEVIPQELCQVIHQPLYITSMENKFIGKAHQHFIDLITP